MFMTDSMIKYESSYETMELMDCLSLLIYYLYLLIKSSLSSFLYYKRHPITISATINIASNITKTIVVFGIFIFYI